MTAPIYILGGSQTDFSLNWAREGLGVFDLFATALQEAVADACIQPDAIEVGHVGNFVGDLFAHQGLLGGFFAEVFPELIGIPTSRHEAACASGSMAILAAMRDLEAGHYDVACVLGLELMRNVDGRTGAAYLGAAAWHGKEATDCQFPWPFLFNDITEAYDQRYGLNEDHLTAIAKTNFANAKKNPLAQTRSWQFPDGAFSNDAGLNPAIEGRVRKFDCGQITDGAACLILANERGARRLGATVNELACIKGWGHRSGPISLSSKLAHSQGQPLLLPHAAQTLTDARQRAGFHSIDDLDGLETHDCFTVTEYLAIDHCGLTAPGKSWQAIEEGRITLDGSFPINPSGGLIGLGHPVGATGVRMVLDCARQVTGCAGDYQIAGAKNMLTFNLGGSATTCASFVVGVSQ